MRAPQPLCAKPDDVLLSIDSDRGPVELPAHCYALDPPYLYVHLNDPSLLRHLPVKTRVLLTTPPAHGAEWQFLTAGWGQLERVDRHELAPRLGATPEHPEPVWRVRLEGGGRAAVGWGPGGRGALQ
jgi:hypothetical protein